MSETDDRDDFERGQALRKAVFETFKHSDLGLDEKTVNRLSNVFANAMINGLRAYNLQESSAKPVANRVHTTKGYPAGDLKRN